jgi:hypothetical protein
MNISGLMLCNQPRSFRCIALAFCSPPPARPFLATQPCMIILISGGLRDTVCWECLALATNGWDGMGWDIGTWVKQVVLEMGILKYGARVYIM